MGWGGGGQERLRERERLRKRSHSVFLVRSLPQALKHWCSVLSVLNCWAVHAPWCAQARVCKIHSSPATPPIFFIVVLECFDFSFLWLSNQFCRVFPSTVAFPSLYRLFVPPRRRWLLNKQVLLMRSLSRDPECHHVTVRGLSNRLKELSMVELLK